MGCRRSLRPIVKIVSTIVLGVVFMLWGAYIISGGIRIIKKPTESSVIDSLNNEIVIRDVKIIELQSNMHAYELKIDVLTTIIEKNIKGGKSVKQID